MELSADTNFDDLNSDLKPAAKSGKSIKLLTLLSSIAPVFLIILTIAYLTIFQKEVVAGFMKEYDVIGISQTGRSEKTRQKQIDNLPIPFEQRQALKEGTIFMGATKLMVQLAIGRPYGTPEQDDKKRERWTYYFNDNSRPTYLFFENDKLVDAAKGTTLDNAEIQ